MSRSSLVVVVVLAAGLGCDPEPARPDSSAVTLRVSAGHELTPFVPSLQRSTGATPYMLELAYSPLSNYATLKRQDGALGVFRVAHGSSRSASELAADLDALALPQLLEVSADRDLLTLRFAAAAQLALVNGGFPVIADGPFTPCGERRGADGAIQQIDLCRREPRADGADGSKPGGADEIAIDRIEVRDTPVAEQWLGMYRDAIDVIPKLASYERDLFDGMASVNVVPYARAQALGLVFNTRRPPWDDPELRRAVAARLDREAIATAMCPGPDMCAFHGWDPAPPARAVDLPPRSSLLVLPSEPDYLERIVRLRLSRDLGIEVIPVREPLDQSTERALAGNFDMLLLPLSLEPDGSLALASALGKIQSVAGYDVAALEALVAAGERDTARRQLEREVPVIPLFRLIQNAVVDKEFCGAAPKDPFSWAWLALLRRCPGGAR